MSVYYNTDEKNNSFKKESTKILKQIRMCFYTFNHATILYTYALILLTVYISKLDCQNIHILSVYTAFICSHMPLLTDSARLKVSFPCTEF